MIKVGNEIEEREYRAERMTDFVTFTIAVDILNMVACGFIKSKGYINAKNGQYLNLRECKIAEKTE